MTRLQYAVPLVLLLCLCGVLTAAMAQTPSQEGPKRQKRALSPHPHYWVNVHGILMSLGWVALLPVGALIAQSRYLQGLKTNVARKEVWFWTHIVIQAVGAALVIAGYGIACSPIAHMDPDKNETTNYAHKILGTIAFIFLLLQVVGGLIRPHPGAKLRGIWSPIHHNLGRLAILLAWINIWLGVAIWLDGRDSIYSYNGLAAWVVPLAVFQGLLLIAYIVGAFRKPRGAAASSEKPIVNGSPVTHVSAVAGTPSTVV